MSSSSRLRPFEWAALAVALGVRVAALLAYEGTVRADHPMVDAFTFWDQAGKLFEGKEAFGAGYYQPPAYPILLSWISKLGGEPSLELVRRVQLLVGMITCGGLLLVGRRLGSRLKAPWIGAAAVLGYSLYRPLLQFEQDLLTPVWTGLLLTAALVFLTRPGGPRAPEGLGAGFAAGLAGALHPTSLVAGVVMGAWAVLGTAGDRGRRALVGGLFALGLVVPIAPTAMENHERFGVVAPVSLNAGINFYIGNNPEWRRTAFLPSGLPFRQLALEAEPHRRDQAERDAYWRGRTFDEIAEMPVTWAMTLGTKLWWSLSDVELPRNEDYRCAVRPGEAMGWMRFLPLRYGFVPPLLVGALVLGWRRKDSAILGLGATWAALHLPMVGFIVASRYRVGSWALVALLVPVGLALLWQERARLKGPLGLLLVALAVVPWLPMPDQTAMNEARCAYSDGHMAYMEGQHHRARGFYEQTVALSPRDMGGHWWLAQLDGRDKDYASALGHMDVVLEQFPDHFPTLKTSAGWARKLRDRDREIGYLRAAYDVPGERTSTGVKLAKALRAAGRETELKALLEKDSRVAARLKGA